MLKIPLADIDTFARNRPESYRTALLAAGTVENEKLLIESGLCARIHAEYPPQVRPTTGGLGDKIARIAQPIAGAIDAVLGTDLRNCGGCKERQEWLNENFPANKH